MDLSRLSRNPAGGAILQLIEILFAIAVITIGAVGWTLYNLGRRAASDLFYLRLQISEIKAEFKAQISEISNRIVNLEQAQPAISDMVRAIERTVPHLQDAMAA